MWYLKEYKSPRGVQRRNYSDAIYLIFSVAYQLLLLKALRAVYPKIIFTAYYRLHSLSDFVQWLPLKD